MELRTYTNLWTVEKRLYKFYDVNLPYPVSVKQLGIAALAFGGWMGLLGIIQIVPFAAPWHLVWILPPALMVWASGRTITEGKTLTDYAVSQVRFTLGQRTFARLRPDRTGGRRLVTGKYWTRRPDRAAPRPTT